jgi:hypothetical protein
VVHAQQRWHQVAHDGRDEARQDRVIAQTADRKHFQSKYGTGQRRAEHRRETGAEARHQQDAPVRRGQ